MKKSLTKQALLSVILGPAGLFYSSVNAALLLTLLTLICVLLASHLALFILAGSLFASVICGVLIVRSQNNLSTVSDFTPSTYIGRVSCRVIGTSRFKRDYSRPLAQAVFKRKARVFGTYALATLCLLITGYIALPTASKQLGSEPHAIDNPQMAKIQNESTVAKRDQSGVTPRVAAAYSSDVSLSNIGVWQVYPDEGKRSFKAQLLGNHYQNTSEGYYRPTLTLSCESGHATISFDAFEVLGTESASLTLLFDTRTAQSFNWNLQSNYRRAYSAASQPLLKNLSRSNNLQISYRPFGSEIERSIEFDLGKSSTITSQLSRQCA